MSSFEIENSEIIDINIILWDTSYKVQSSQRHLEKF